MVRGGKLKLGCSLSNSLESFPHTHQNFLKLPLENTAQDYKASQVCHISKILSQT